MSFLRGVLLALKKQLISDVMLYCLKLFSDVKDTTGLTLLESGKRTVDKQELHTVDAAKLLELRLKHTLLGLVHRLFGKGEQCFLFTIVYVCGALYFEVSHASLMRMRFHDTDCQLGEQLAIHLVSMIFLEIYGANIL